MRRLFRRLPTSIDARVRAIAWASLAVQVGIVGTGGAVRLTDSGLGCPTWPRCTPETYVVMPEQGIHGAIEFGNRLLTFVLAAVAIAAVLFVTGLRRERPALFRLALALLAGIPAQAALGGLTVLTGLDPWLVGAHFIVSAVLVSLAAAFVLRTYPDVRLDAGVARGVALTARLAAAAAAVTVVLGVITTGAGPHAGDAATARNGLDVDLLQRVHSVPAYALLALTAALAVLIGRSGSGLAWELVRALLVLEVMQVAVGVAQVRLGVPALLVGLHMLLACGIVAATTVLVMTLELPGARAPRVATRHSSSNRLRRSESDRLANAGDRLPGSHG